VGARASRTRARWADRIPRFLAGVVPARLVSASLSSDQPVSKTLIIAEKPSVAADITRALGGFAKHDDYFESDKHVVSSAVGHLLEIGMPRTRRSSAASGRSRTCLRSRRNSRSSRSRRTKDA
jgi:hypothetical protein